jgi:hypothetical protein
MLSSAELFLADDDVTGLIIALQGIGSLAARAGDDRTAVRLDSAAVLRAKDIGVDPPLINVLIEPIAEARGRLGAAEIAAEQEAAKAIEARPFLEALVAERSAAAAR